MGFGWLLNQKITSDNYGKHYCQSCGRYAKEMQTEGEFITPYCYHCGAEMELIETNTGIVDIYQCGEEKV